MTSIDAHTSTLIGERPRASLRDTARVAVDRLGALVDALLDWHERTRQRRALLSLGDRALQDFAASRADACAEGDKPFWRA